MIAMASLDCYSLGLIAKTLLDYHGLGLIAMVCF